ncbi:MAG: transposase [Massilioclostridium sp.]|nr:transposase [Massilioclostridium sp.]
MSDHIHMLEGIPLKIGMSSLVEYLKEKISLMIQEKYPELKYKYGN